MERNRRTAHKLDTELKTANTYNRKRQDNKCSRNAKEHFAHAHEVDVALDKATLQLIERLVSNRLLFLHCLSGRMGNRARLFATKLSINRRCFPAVAHCPKNQDAW